MSSSLPEWTCPMCTMINSGARTICEACNTPRSIRASPPIPTRTGGATNRSSLPAPTINTRQSQTQTRRDSRQASPVSSPDDSPPPPPPSSSYSAPQPTNRQREWVCPRCTFHNDMTHVTCEVCDAPQPPPASSSLSTSTANTLSAPSPSPSRSPNSSPVPPLSQTRNTRADSPVLPTPSPPSSQRGSASASINIPTKPNARKDKTPQNKDKTRSSPTSSTSASQASSSLLSPPSASSSYSSSVPSAASSLSRADQTYYLDHESDVDFLASMGFRLDTAIAALRLTGDKDAALDHLLIHPPTYSAHTPPKSPHEYPPISITSLSKSRSAETNSNSHPSITQSTATGKSSATKIPQSSSPAPITPSSSSPQPSASSLSRSVPTAAPTFTSTPTRVQLPPPNLSSSSTSSITWSSSSSASSSSSSSLKPPSSSSSSSSSSDDIQRKRKLTEEAAQQAKQREFERQRLFAELAAQESDLQRKEKQQRLLEIDQVKKKREEEERIRKLRVIQKDKQHEAELLRSREELRMKQQEKSSTQQTIESAMQQLEQSYDTDRVHACYQLLLRILQNVITKGTQEQEGGHKYRVLKMNTESIQKHIIRPVFGLFVLKQVGWREETNEAGEPVLTISAADVQRYTPQIQREIDRLHGKLQQIVTVIPSLFSSIADKYTLELLYFLAMELRSIFINVITSPEERNFRSIDMESDTYQTLFVPVPEVLPVLESFGFHVHTTGVYRIVENPDVKLFEAGVIDLNTIISQQVNQTPIVVGLRHLFAVNAGKKVKAFYDMFLPVLDNVLTDPHETKYHKVRVDKFLSKCPVTDGITMFPLFGFVLNDDQTVAQLPYPGFSVELLRLRTQEIQRAWKVQIERGRARREAAAAQRDAVLGNNNELATAASNQDGATNPQQPNSSPMETD